MPLSRRQLSTPAQNAAEPAWPRARRGRLKEPSDSASDAEDDAEARSCVKTKLWRLTPSTRPDLIHRIATGRLESEAELAERRSGGMRGVNRRRAASSDAAAASSPSDSDSEDDAAAKSGRLESDSEFSDRRSGGMGGSPAGGGGPPCGATGTSSSAVKSIVAACSVRASCGSIAASRPPLVPCSSRSSAAYCGGCGSADTRDAGHRVLSRLAIEVSEVQQPSCTQPCCRLRFTGCPTAGRASGRRVPARYARLAKVQ